MKAPKLFCLGLAVASAGALAAGVLVPRSKRLRTQEEW